MTSAWDDPLVVPVQVEEYQVEKITSCEHSAHIYWMKDKQIKDVQLHKSEQSILKHFDFESGNPGGCNVGRP